MMAGRTPTTTLTLFGSPVLRLNGTVHDDFLSNKVRAVLYRLACADAPLARSTLAALCWGDLPQAQAAKNLRQALYDIRRHLPLSVTRQTVALVVGEVDVRAFAAALAAGDDAAAVALYGAPLLEGFTVAGAPDFALWLAAERAARHAQALAALRRLLDRPDLAAEQRMAYLRRWVALNPAAEAEQRALIERLAQAGDLAGALAHYDELRRALAAVSGGTPAAETQRLVARVQRALAGAGPPSAALPPLVGRQAELAQVQAWLAAGQRLVTICGVGGVGKTRLAQALLAAAGPLDDARLVALAEAETLTAALTVIAAAYDLPPQSPERLAGRLHGLLILDNCEHLVGDGLAGWLLQVLEAAPDVRLLLTSRERLFLQQERVLQMGGLASGEAAIELFVQAARRLLPAFAPDAAERQAIATIAAHVDGLPLALEIAAALVTEHDCATLAARLGAVIPLQADDGALAALFDSSWRLLTSAERGHFVALALFAGSFDLAAARQVIGLTPPALRGLIHKSLLQFDPQSGRYALHALLHGYARQKLAALPADAAAALHAAHSAYYLDFLTQRLSAVQQNDPAALRALTAEFANIRAMWLHALAHGDQMTLLRAYLPLAYFLEEAGRHQEAQALFQAALARLDVRPTAAAAEQPFLVAACLLTLANSAERLGDLAAGQVWGERGLAICRAQGIEIGIVHGLLILGRLALRAGAYTAAAAYLQELVAKGHTGPFAPTVAQGQLRLGETLYALGEGAAAVRTLRDALPRLAERGGLYADLLLGVLVGGDHWRQALTTADRLDRPQLHIEARLAQLPHVIMAGDLVQARALLAVVRQHEAWLEPYTLDLLLVQAQLATAERAWPAAEAALRQAEAVAELAPRGALRLALWRGRLLAAQGRSIEAQPHLAQVATDPRTHWQERQWMVA